MRAFIFISLIMLVMPALATPALAHQDDQGATDSGSNVTSNIIVGDYRLIESNGIPDHTTGKFPSRGNPNPIFAQDIHVRIPLHPTLAPKPVPVRVPGIAVNGVMFNPRTAECFGVRRGGDIVIMRSGDKQAGKRQAGDRQKPNRQDSSTRLPEGPGFPSEPENCEWREEAIIGGVGRLGIDASNAHVQRSGLYHYHGIPTALVRRLQAENPDHKGLFQVGYAADGYDFMVDPSDHLKPSWQLKRGVRPTEPLGDYTGQYTADFEFIAGSGDLDSCNGIEIDGQYVYVLTKAFPFVPRCLKGVPDPSFKKKRRR